MKPNGSERLDHHGGRRLTIQGISDAIFEIVQVESERSNEDGVDEVVIERRAISNRPLSPEEQEKVARWLEHEWPKRTN